MDKTELKKPSPSCEDLGEVYSNCDHTYDAKVRDKLKIGGYCAGHSAWNFHGTVWFEDGRWYNAIMQFHSHVATIEGATIQEVIDEAIERYGAA